jgi:hypothetical protein
MEKASPMSKTYAWVLCATLPILLIISATMIKSGRTPTPSTLSGSKAVESSVHDFMESINKPAYQRLVACLSQDILDEDAWKAVLADSLLLAESGNLLLLRPIKDPQAWAVNATNVRESGTKLYESAMLKEITPVRLNFDAMLHDCDACHQQFSNGMPALPRVILTK